MSGRALLILSSREIRRKACEHCGELFGKDPRNTWAYFERAKYCSRQCFGAATTRKADATRATMADEFGRWFAKGDGCWEWTGALDKDGYGVFSYAGKTYRAPKIALELDGRPVPEGLYACHHCDNQPCVRPDHLYPGTPTQNMEDAKSRGRLASGSRRSRLSEADVVAIRASTDTHSAIAAMFGVSRAAISLIKERKTWRHLP